MAPNRRGAAPAGDADGEGMVSKAEVEARGTGTTEEELDSYDFTRPWRSEARVFFTGEPRLLRAPPARPSPLGRLRTLAPRTTPTTSRTR
jgi:hypothetical protein